MIAFLVYPKVVVFGALQEASSVDLFHTRSNPLSPASFNLRDLAEELSPNPKSRVTCEWLAVHAILLCSNISIVMYASLMCMVRLLCQLQLRFLLLRWESAYLWDPVLVSGIGLAGIRFLAICSHLASDMTKSRNHKVSGTGGWSICLNITSY